MAHRSILIVALLLALPAVGNASGNRQVVPDGYRQVAQRHGVPAESLYSLALAESSKKLPQGERPWPWTINVAGKGYRYNTRLEAWQALQVFISKYPLKRIDVGIAQVNLGWNGHRFPSTWAAFDPYTNLNVAAVILRECYNRQPGSWLNAAGCYHHPAGGVPAMRYKAIVQRKLATLAPPTLPLMRLATLTPDPTFIWTEPRRSSR